jgi:hypothetical protein
MQESLTFEKAALPGRRRGQVAAQRRKSRCSIGRSFAWLSRDMRNDRKRKRLQARS